MLRAVGEILNYFFVQNCYLLPTMRRPLYTVLQKTATLFFRYDFGK